MNENHFYYNCIHCNEICGKWAYTVDLVSLPIWNDLGDEGIVSDIPEEITEYEAKQIEES